MKLLSKYGMAACCAVMLAPVALVLVTGGSLASLFSDLALVVPIVACVGMHLVMHRALGKSCHGHDAKEPAEREAGSSSPGRAAEHVPQFGKAPLRGASIVPPVQASGTIQGQG